MSGISYIISNDNRITAVVEGKSYVVSSDHPGYKQVLQTLKDRDAEAFVKLVDVQTAVQDYSAGNVVITSGNVIYKGRPIENSLTRRLMGLMRNGFPFEPWVLFLNNLMENPSKRAVQELYRFLEHHDLPMTDDGHFLAYKRVRPDFTDVHTGTVNNQIGQVVEMDRNLVDDNWGVDCSEGYHVGSMSYVANFGTSPGNQIVIVKINPIDVVTVPSGETNKCRVCKYEVVSLYEGTLDEALYTSSGNPAVPPVSPTGSAGNRPEEDDYLDPDDDELDDDEDDDLG